MRRFYAGRRWEYPQSGAHLSFTTAFCGCSVLIDQCVVMCIVEPVIQVQARMGARVWSQFVLEVSESTELLDSQVTRDN